MITTAARIVALDGAHALVECRRSSPCVACGGCVQARFAGQEKDTARLPIRLPGTAGSLTAERSNLEVGDNVVLGLEGRDLLRGAATMYLFPLAGLIGMSSLAAMFAADHDALAMCAGFAGLVLGWVAVGAWGRWRGSTPQARVLAVTPMVRSAR